ncbi:hypothetical protein GGTG_05452 [Gaeumannomyces tritici R3-111a-1]|uniref:Uncharacterized protein n=1 Tax=Gaeumannomyces tritici (strain R3-111a-1) TaxID=644352 RepID=J3NVY9_GAET3|nr:hypothetical protein GGTG_05452 [Gaeumannomyces tritici R3-111a-1]EJT75519.1 hypothetical protein GGTG_05452 [Gaeumannomyces tritici R3-111a-1]
MGEQQAKGISGGAGTRWPSCSVLGLVLVVVKPTQALRREKSRFDCNFLTS